jgi:hypothetical protein
MSYARFGWDGSDVYVFKSVGNKEHPGGWLECCGCLLPSNPGRFLQAFSTAGMIRHLRAHMAAGQHVPSDVIPELRADDVENFPRLPSREVTASELRPTDRGR